MSKYTTEIRYICENAAGYDESKGFNDVDKIIADSISSIFSFNFPIFDENYRNVICTKILRHYYTREIGFETVGLWKLKMQTKLNEIMPYYNQLYESELIKFNPLYDVDLTTTHEGEKFGAESGKQNITSIHSEKAENNDDYSVNKTSSGIGIENLDNTGNENNIEITSIDRTQSGSESKNSANTNIENNVIKKDASTETSENEIENKNKEENTATNNNEESSGNKNTHKADTNTENARERNYDLYSDTPQGALVGVESEEYLTNARKVTNEKNNDQNSVENVNESTTANVNSQGAVIANDKENNLKMTNLDKNENATEDANKVSVENGSESVSNSLTSGEDAEKTGNINRNENEKTERFDSRTESETNTGTRRITNEGNKAENLNKENNITSTEAYTLHVIGKQAGVSFSKMIKEFRDTFLNIDMEIINELSPLFMNLW